MQEWTAIRLCENVLQQKINKWIHKEIIEANVNYLGMHVSFLIFPLTPFLINTVTISPDYVQLEGIYQARLKFSSFLCSLNINRMYYTNEECE